MLLAIAGLILGVTGFSVEAADAPKATVMTVGEMCGGCAKKINSRLEKMPGGRLDFRTDCAEPSVIDETARFASRSACRGGTPLRSDDPRSIRLLGRDPSSFGAPIGFVDFRSGTSYSLTRKRPRLSTRTVQSASLSVCGGGELSVGTSSSGSRSSGSRLAFAPGGSKRGPGHGFRELCLRLPGSDVVTEVADVSSFDHTRSGLTSRWSLRRFSGAPPQAVSRQSGASSVGSAHLFCLVATVFVVASRKLAALGRRCSLRGELTYCPKLGVT